MTSTKNLNNGAFVNLYNTKAHVFEINPETKTSWLKRGENAIPVMLVASKPGNETGGRRELRILATDNYGERVLDTVILPKTNFAKKSPVFGQWIDPKGTLYGLGFVSEMEQMEFIETFQRLQREILSPPQPAQYQNLESNSRTSSAGGRVTANWQNVGGGPNPNTSSETNGRYQPNRSADTVMHHNHQQYSDSTVQAQSVKSKQMNSNGNLELSLNNGNGTELGGNQMSYPRSQSMFGLQGQANNNAEPKNRNNTPDPDGSSLSLTEWQIREQLKYDNERLRQKLEEINRDASYWHVEISNLRTNNIKLTQALEESKANAKEWDRELYSLRNENKDLKVRLKAMESDSELDNEYREGLRKLYAEEYEGEMKKKDDQIEQLTRSLEEMELKAQNNNLDESATVVENVISLHQKQQLDVLNADLEARINDLSNIRKKYVQLVEKMYH